MKNLRWITAAMATGCIMMACSVKTTSSDDDTGTGGSSTTSAASTTATSTSTSASTSTSTASSSVASSTATTGGGSTCSQLATFQECAQCFCTENQAGCGSYVKAVEDNLYCGMTCGAGDCATWCASDKMADPDMACSTCVDGIGEGNADIDNFVAACQADSNCINFAGQLQMCPSS